MTKPFEDNLRNFAMANLLVENALDIVEKEQNINLGRIVTKEISLNILDQYDFEQKYKNDAIVMARYYEVFYCLEVFIRNLISERLFELFGKDWWFSNKKDGKPIVTQAIKDNAEKARNNEIKQAFTSRSADLLDYTTFGELGNLLTQNWDIFGDMFTNQEAVIKVMYQLNTLRGPIAHCSKLADDEVLRLNLALKDWFRTMS